MSYKSQTHNLFSKHTSITNEEMYKIASKHKVPIYNASEIEKIRLACKTSKKILDTLIEHVAPGLSTKELDTLSRALHKQYNVIPAPLNFGSPPFPASICTSVNDVVCHGIPSNYKLKTGDIINIDVSVQQDGFFGDCSRTTIVGSTTSNKTRALVDVTELCLNMAIQICRPFNPLHVIGYTIEGIASAYGLSVVRQFIGHGIGHAFHHPPQVLHFAYDSPIYLLPGMIFTIEPMINMESYQCYTDKDLWTVKTKDKKPSAQFEHTIVITEDKAEILTCNTD